MGHTTISMRPIGQIAISLMSWVAEYGCLGEESLIRNELMTLRLNFDLNKVKQAESCERGRLDQRKQCQTEGHNVDIERELFVGR